MSIAKEEMIQGKYIVLIFMLSLMIKICCILFKFRQVKHCLFIIFIYRCNIPVIVMGETGCGKTRLVKFLCALQTPGRQDINTMVLVKVMYAQHQHLICITISIA